MKRKIILITLVCIAVASLCFAFAACKSDGKQQNNNQTQQPGGDNSNTHEHDFGSWEIITEATCTEDGLRQRTCSLCGYVQTNIIAASGHSFNVSNICNTCGYEL